MRLSHGSPALSATFDDPNLVSAGGLAPVLALAAQCRLGGLVADKLTLKDPGGVNAALKVPALVAGMIAGADSIADMDLLRHGGMGRLFTGICKDRHRHQEFLAFLRHVARAYPEGELHLVMDNYATHKRPEVKKWLAANPRIHVHFTPTSASWINAVEGFFSAPTRRRLQRGDFTSIVDLQGAINRYIAEHNSSPRPFVWTKSAKAILAKVQRTPEPSE